MKTLPFVDAHFHPLQIAYFSKAIDLSEVHDDKSLENTLSQANEPIIGYHFVEYDYFNGGDLLTQLFPNTPVIVLRTCLHKLWLNQKAATLFAYDLNLHSDGSVVEEDVWTVIDRVFDFYKDVRRNLIKEMFVYLLSLGIIGGVEMGVTPEIGQLMVDVAGSVGFEYFYFIKSNYDPIDCVGNMRCLGVKFFADGSLGARTAALQEPYSDGYGKGLLNWDNEKLFNEILKWHMAGYDVAVHVIGDRALRQVLEIWKEIFRTYPRPHHHRLEHLQIMYPGAISEISSIGLYASIQPTFSKEIPWAVKRIGKQRMAYSYRWRDLITSTKVLIGTDAPVYGISPMEVIDGLINPVYWSQSFLEPANVYIGKAIESYTVGNMRYLGLIADVDNYHVLWEVFPYQVKQIVSRGKVVYES